MAKTKRDRTGEPVEPETNAVPALTPAADEAAVEELFGDAKPKRGRKPKRDQDRTVMDAASAATPDFMRAQAEDDRRDAVTRSLDKGLKVAKDAVAQMAKAVAHGLASDSDAMKEAVLEELATLGNHVRDEARAAMRRAKATVVKAKPAASTTDTP